MFMVMKSVLLLAVSLSGLFSLIFFYLDFFFGMITGFFSRNHGGGKKSILKIEFEREDVRLYDFL